jgi:hypothetical protein
MAYESSELDHVRRVKSASVSERPRNGLWLFVDLADCPVRIRLRRQQNFLLRRLLRPRQIKRDSVGLDNCNLAVPQRDVLQTEAG